MPGFGGSSFGFAPFAGMGGAGSASFATDAGPATVISPAVIDGDHELDENGNLVDGDPVDEEALFRLNTVQGTFFGSQTLGNGVTRVKVYTNTSLVQIRSAVALALEPMVSRGVIANIAVLAEAIPRNSTAIAWYRVSYDKTDRVE